jgi:DNA repair ATPase RecN
MKKRLTLLFILIIFISLFAQSSTFISIEEHQKVKDALINMTIRWQESINLIENMSTGLDRLAEDLNNIENKSEELKAVLKKYNIEK